MPTLVRKISALYGRNRHIPDFQHESTERGIGEGLVVIDRKLTQYSVTGDQFPAASPAIDFGWAHLNVRDDDAVQSDLVAGVHSLISRNATMGSTSPLNARRTAAV